MARPMLIAAGLLAACSACVPNRIYRSPDCSQPDDLERRGLSCSALHEQLRTGEFDAVDVAVNPQNVDLSWPYRLTFIEFSDNGDLFDRREVDKALSEIAAAKADAQAAGGPAVVALFVHGWKNNASDSSGNVWGFRQVLAGLSRQFARPTSLAGGKVPVVGIYVGWRGAILNAPIIEQFTFWDRRRKSQNLPRPPMIDALISLMKAAKGPNYTDPGTLSLMVGHSFGGAVLETALSQTLMDGVVNSNDHRLRSLADLVVFLNEAQEALRSHPLIEALIENGITQDHCKPSQTDADGNSKFENPTIISISSTGDYATRAFYPFGQALVWPRPHLRTYPQPDRLGFTSERPMFFNTTAHLDKFQSHLLRAFSMTGTSEGENPKPPTDDPDMNQALAACQPSVDLNLSGIRYLIVNKPGSVNNTPYWVMQMPTTIVPDHSTIFTPVFRNFLISLLQVVTLP